MKFNTRQLLFAFSFVSITVISCQKGHKYPELSNQLNDSIAPYYNSELKYASAYNAYLRATSKDVTVDVEKKVTNTYYPWRVNLTKTKVDSFLVHLQQNLKVEADYKSSFGEFSPIRADFVPYDDHNVMSELLRCKLVGYNLTNRKGEKITIDETDVSRNINLGSISFGLAKWDLQNQEIKGDVTLELTIPYTIHEIDLTPKDKHKSFKFDTTTIDVLEFENNVMHYRIKDANDYVMDAIVDNCMGGKSTLRFPEYFYDKLRIKPDLSYKKFITDSIYFELGKPFKKEPKNVYVIYFDSCNPDLIYLYGYHKSAVLKRNIVIPIDTKIR